VGPGRADRPLKHAILLLCLAACEAAAVEIAGRVVAVESGDTFALAVADSGNVTVRLSDIGAPQASAFYAPSSRQLLANMVLDKTVRVETSKASSTGRIIGHVYRGLLDVNLELVKAGAAWYCLEYSNDTAYMPYQSEAIRQQRGLWSRTTTFDALVACRANPPAVKS
jgi:endonuclease YncB( thermonuclease family)